MLLLLWWCNLRPTLCTVTVACCLMLARKVDDNKVWARFQALLKLVCGKYVVHTFFICVIGLCPTVSLGLLRERGDIWKKCGYASGVQGSHPPWCCELCAHQHAQEQAPALCCQRTGRWVFSVHIICNIAPVMIFHFRSVFLTTDYAGSSESLSLFEIFDYERMWACIT